MVRCVLLFIMAAILTGCASVEVTPPIKLTTVEAVPPTAELFPRAQALGLVAIVGEEAEGMLVGIPKGDWKVPVRQTVTPDSEEIGYPPPLGSTPYGYVSWSHAGPLDTPLFQVEDNEWTINLAMEELGGEDVSIQLYNPGGYLVINMIASFTDRQRIAQANLKVSGLFWIRIKTARSYAIILEGALPKPE